MLRPEGMTYNQYVALVTLGQLPSITGRTLSKSLGVTEAAGSGIVKALLADDLITNGATPGSGNRRELHLTSAGEDKSAHCARLLGHSLDDNARAIGIGPSSLASAIRDLHAIGRLHYLLAVAWFTISYACMGNFTRLFTPHLRWL
ncbi:MarR family transcriptional regulator [Brevibacterium renqingii]|uniref:MarR family transcriptional regulator n=1 Tax=Brevibacterium renqingii TaxID=2776916 RepID=UPI001AE0936B|nr:MarR family transcriptional regulator [Brevibacterium renqingii]